LFCVDKSTVRHALEPRGNILEEVNVITSRLFHERHETGAYKILASVLLSIPPTCLLRNSSPPNPHSPRSSSYPLPLKRLQSDGESSDANSTPPATPIFQPSVLHPDPTVLVTIISYAHVPPLQPQPDLQYDLRTFPSPSPEKYASKYDGRGKKAREWVNGEGLYVELLGKVEEEVLTRGRELEQETMKEKMESEKAEREENEKAEAEKKAAKEEAPKSAVTEASDSNSDAALVEKMETLGVEEAEPQDIPPKVLRIGVSSEMGRDRSVAFVEELGRKKWPVEWAVCYIGMSISSGVCARARPEAARKAAEGRT
jgi:hypothetical protein